MKISELLSSRPTLSLEFFPPKTPKGLHRLDQVLAELSCLDVAFVSITTGAGGSSHAPTMQQALALRQNYAFEVMAHITCMQHSRAQINSLLDAYGAAGIDNILALSGDPPQAAGPGVALPDSVGSSGPGAATPGLPGSGAPSPGEFKYASELVAEVVRHPHRFGIGVAAHPEVHPRSVSRELDRKYLAQKLSQADFAVTQFFFDVSHYLRLVEELAELGCDKPVIAGIMVVASPERVKRFAELNGTQLDHALWERLDKATTGDRIKLAVEAACNLCQELLEAGAPGLHLYTMNQSETSLALCSALDFAR